MGEPRDPRQVRQRPSAVAVEVAVDEPITLGQFVKLAGLAATGGEAKQLVGAGRVRLNAQIETRRGHQLAGGDVVEADGRMAKVVMRTDGSRRPRD